MANLVTIFCEGPHDVAFIYKILKTLGYKSNNATLIGDFPPPFNGLLKSEVEKTDIEGLNLTQVRRTLLPSETMIKEDKYLFLYSLGGDGSANIRQETFAKLNNFIPKEGEIIRDRLPEGTSLSVVYLFDADDDGIVRRINLINNEINMVFQTENKTLFQKNASWIRVNEIQIGAYIFTGADNNTGKLENILIPLMSEANDVIFENATNYINTHHNDDRLFPLKIRETDNNITEVRSTKKKDKFKLDAKKSVIGAAGQLQRSGASNVVIIRDSDYITLKKINSNNKCVEIKNFLSQI
jgi:hypothetical protein